MIIFTDGLKETSSWRPERPPVAPIGTASERSITCADAITRVLEGSVRGMRAADIAREINRDELYRRKDGRPLPAYQVSSIAQITYPAMTIAAPAKALVAAAGRALNEALERRVLLVGADGSLHQASEWSTRSIEPVEERTIPTR